MRGCFATFCGPTQRKHSAIRRSSPSKNLIDVIRWRSLARPCLASAASISLASLSGLSQYSPPVVIDGSCPGSLVCLGRACICAAPRLMLRSVVNKGDLLFLDNDVHFLDSHLCDCALG